MSADILDDLTLLIPDVARCLLTQGDRLVRRYRIVRPMYWPILMELKRSPGLSQNALAASIGVTPITITRLVDRLEARHLVRRYRDRDDRRIWRLKLTQEAASLIQEIARCQAELCHGMTEGLDPSILDTAHAALRKIKDNLTVSRPPNRSSGGFANALNLATRRDRIIAGTGRLG
jgi:MarR family transcriptional regulator for hemolysin